MLLMTRTALLLFALSLLMAAAIACRGGPAATTAPESPVDGAAVAAAPAVAPTVPPPTPEPTPEPTAGPPATPTPLPAGCRPEVRSAYVAMGRYVPVPELETPDPRPRLKVTARLGCIGATTPVYFRYRLLGAPEWNGPVVKNAQAGQTQMNFAVSFLPPGSYEAQLSVQPDFSEYKGGYRTVPEKLLN